MSEMMKEPAERIRRVAERLFYSEGIRAIGVDRIIAESEVAKATFYRHYPSKDDLVLAFVRARDAAYRTWLTETVERLAPAPADRALAVFDAIGERFRAKDFRGCAFANAVSELADEGHAAHRAAAEHKQAVRGIIAGYLEGAGLEGGTAQGLAADFVLLIDGANVTAVREGSADAAGRAKAMAASLLAASRASKRNTRRN